MAVDMFLKIENIKGESKDSNHSEWIEIQSYSWGLSQTGSFSTGAGGGAGKVSMQDFSFTKRLDKSTPKLMEYCATGNHIKDAVLHVARTKNDQQTYLEYKLSDVLVSSYSPACSSGGSDGPVDQISLNFTKIQMVYSEIDCSTNKVIGRHEASHTIKL